MSENKVKQHGPTPMIRKVAEIDGIYKTSELGSSRSAESNNVLN